MLIKGLIVILFLCEQSLQNPLSPTKFDTKSPIKDTALIPQPLVITKPEEKSDISAFLSIWEHRFSTLSDAPFSAADERSEGAPKIILAVTPLKMTNLIAQDQPHPLYSSFYEKLTDDFILDSLSAQTIDFNDPKLTSPEGVTIKTMGGKDLIFKKDQNTNKFTVNDIEIEKHETITGDTIIVITSDFLFNYYQDIRAAYDELVKSPQPGEPAPGFRAEVHEAVPQIPESLKDSQSGAVPSGLIRIWENRLSNLDSTQTTDIRAEETVPKTVLAVTSSKMNNLIPQDTVHPLYSPSYEKLTDDFILDSLSTQTIDFNDPQLASPQGVTIVSMSGKNLLFRKDQFKDTITVNGIEIENHQQLPDGTNVVILSDFLFNNYDRVQKAFQELVSQPGTPSLGPFGENRPPPPPPPASLGTFGETSPFPHPPPSQDTSRSGNERSVPATDAGSESAPSGPETGLPEIPATFSSAFENDKFLNIWKFRLSKIQESSVKIDSRVAETILPVTYFRMINLVPQDAPHPLYTDKYQTLADNFILDSLSTEKIDFEDPNLTTVEGVVIKTFTGKDLVFKKDASTDKISVNGIDIENHQLLSDQKTVVVLSDFLFNYYDDTKKAFQELTGGPDSSNGFKRSKQSEAGAHSGTEHRTETEIATGDLNIPQVPQDLEDPQDAPDASQFVFLWKNRLSNVEKTPGFVRTATQPKTVLVVEPFKMTNLIPQDAPHPLYSTEHADLTDRFILESLSTEDVNFDDPKLLTPEGLTIKTMNGKDLTFKKDETTGKIQVNGIDVVSHKVLKGNTDLIVTSYHLFNIYDDVQTAFNQLLKTDTGNPWFGSPTVLPAVPKVLEGTNTEIDASGLVNVWENRLTKFGTTSTGDSGSETPKTVVAVTFIKMINLTPQDAPNPLYSEQYEHLANGFVLDSLSSEAIDVNDPALLSNSGKIIKTISGRDLVFKKNEKTNKLTINGIEVENNKTFEDGTSVFVISDFLFDHQTAVRSAFDALLRESPKHPGLTQILV